MNKIILFATLGAALVLGGCSSTGMRQDSMGIGSVQSAPDTRVGDSRTMAGSYAMESPETRTMGSSGNAWMTPDAGAKSLAPGRN